MPILITVTGGRFSETRDLHDEHRRTDRVILSGRAIRRKICVRETSMRYRSFGKLEFRVSALGFGCMRFPTQNGSIDEREVTRMLHAAIEGGVNYLDTAWPYHNGESEPFVGRALRAGAYRDTVALATKLPSWLIKTRADMDSYLDRQLVRLQTDTIDFYLLHALNKKYWDTLISLDALEWAEEKRRQGKIRHLGFSFHDEYEVFDEIVTAYDWEFCQIQYNYMNRNYQAGRRGLRLAARRGLAVVVMEPLLGGHLAKSPATVQTLWASASRARTPVDWALQWLWDHEEVSVVLSGMSTMQQVDENLASADRSGVATLTAEERALVDRVRLAFEEKAVVPCTRCGYCVPCPHGVDIPRNFTNYNNAIMFDALEQASGEYAWMKRAFELGLNESDARAASCIGCDECLPKCPQKIAISSLMPEIDAALAR